MRRAAFSGADHGRYRRTVVERRSGNGERPSLFSKHRHEKTSQWSGLGLMTRCRSRTGRYAGLREHVVYLTSVVRLVVEEVRHQEVDGVGAGLPLVVDVPDGSGEELFV